MSLDNLKNVETKILEHSNWKNIIADFIKNEFSEIEMDILIKNRDNVKDIIYI